MTCQRWLYGWPTTSFIEPFEWRTFLMWKMWCHLWMGRNVFGTSCRGARTGVRISRNASAGSESLLFSRNISVSSLSASRLNVRHNHTVTLMWFIHPISCVQTRQRTESCLVINHTTLRDIQGPLLFFKQRRAEASAEDESRSQLEKPAQNWPPNSSSWPCSL